MAPVTFLGAIVITAPVALIIQRQELTRDYERALGGLLLVLAGIAFSALLLSILVISWLYVDERILKIGITLAICVFLPTSLSAMWQASLERTLDFKSVSIIELSSSFTATIVTVSMALNDGGIWSLAVGAAAGSLMQCVILFLTAGAAFSPRFDFRDILRNDGRYGGHVTIGSLMTQGFFALETLILGRGLGTSGLGVWRTCLDLVNIPFSKIMPIVNRIGFPAYARVGNDPAAIRHYVTLSLRVLSTIFIPIYWGIAVVAQYLIPTVMGPQWVEAIPIAVLFGFFMPLKLLQFCLILPHQGLGNAGLVNRAMVTISASSIAGLTIGIWFGLVAGAACMLSFGAIGLVYAIEPARRSLQVGWRELLGSCSASMLSGVAMCAGVRATDLFVSDGSSDAKMLLVLVPVGALTFITVFLILDRNRTIKSVLPMLREFAGFR